jgi:uncharacterized membrane protein
MSKSQTTFSRPPKVSWAVKLLYACIAVGALIDVVAFFQALQEHPSAAKDMVAAFIGGAILGLGVLFLLAYKIARGRNWARIIFFILLCMSVVTTFLTPWQHLMANKLGLAGLAAQMLLQIAAAVLLLSSEARAWFAAQKADG